MPATQCKHGPRESASLRSRALVVLLVAALHLIPACAANWNQRVVTLAELRASPAQASLCARRAVVFDLAPLADLLRPVTPRVSLIDIDSRGAWQRVRTLAPDLGPCPDLSRGRICILAAQLGDPLDGAWPLTIDAGRLRHGAALLSARTSPGTYFATSATYLQAAQFPNLAAVVIVEINGQRYTPGDAG